ncbi:dickkopf-related protein 3 [Arapaima gigas]
MVMMVMMKRTKMTRSPPSSGLLVLMLGLLQLHLRAHVHGASPTVESEASSPVEAGPPPGHATLNDMFREVEKLMEDTQHKLEEAVYKVEVLSASAPPAMLKMLCQSNAGRETTAVHTRLGGAGAKVTCVTVALLFPVCTGRPAEHERCHSPSNHLMELLSWDMDGEGPREYCPCSRGLQCQRQGRGSLCLRPQNSSSEELADPLYSEDYIV